MFTFQNRRDADRLYAGFDGRPKPESSERRPKALDRDKRDLAVKLYDEKQHTISQICQMMHISKPTLYKYVESAKSRPPKPRTEARLPGQ